MAVKKAPLKKAAAKKSVRKKAATIPDVPEAKALVAPVGTLDSSAQLSARAAALVQVWQETAKDPSPQNVERLARAGAELESGARRVHEHARALADALRISDVSLQRLSAASGVPAADMAAAVAPKPPAAGVEVKRRLFDEDEEERIEFGGPDEEEAGRRPAQPEKPDIGLDGLMQQVSTSVVNAQKRLDLTSLAYMHTLKDSPIPPSLFSIQKLTASTKVGLTVGDGSNLFVKLFGRPQDTTNFSETTISFDVVSSPPPPGGSGIFSAPVPGFLVVGPERDSVAAAIADMRDVIRSKGIELPANTADWLPAAIVLRAGSEALPAANRADYVVLWRGADPNKSLLLVRLKLAAPRDAQIMKIDGDLRLPLFDLIATIRDWEQAVTLSPGQV